MDVLKVDGVMKPLAKTSAAARESEAIDRLHEALPTATPPPPPEDGQRTVLAVFDLADPSQIPEIRCPSIRARPRSR